MAPRTEPQPLVSLSTEEPGGPTAMARAHANGMRKGIARLKSQLKDPETVEPLLKALLLSYLAEWDAVYGEGVNEAVQTTTRTILLIRQDTIRQAVTELGRA